MPFIVYQVMAFILPGLQRNERAWLFVMAPFATLLFAAWPSPQVCLTQVGKVIKYPKLLDADGLSASVDITEVAGLLERGGLHGLGFSIGVATNLLPDLRQSSTNAWHSLRMRGGLRANWWRGLQLMALTVLTNALRHTEEIVLAAEVRAFRPELSRRASLRIGTVDGWVAAACVLSLALVLIFV